MLESRPAAATDAAAWYEEFFRVHYLGVRTYVEHVWPRVDTDEVVSRVFETAWRRMADVPSDAARGWLLAVARNCALNALRSDRRREARVGAAVATRFYVTSELYDVAVPRDTTDALKRALTSLSDADQEVLLLAIWSGLSGADLGAALEITPATAAVRLSRARARLRDRFDRERQGSGEQ